VRPHKLWSIQRRSNCWPVRSDVVVLLNVECDARRLCTATPKFERKTFGSVFSGRKRNFAFCVSLEDNQCTCNVTPERVRLTIVAVQKEIIITYSEFVFVALVYQACNAHAPCCRLWPGQLYDIFPHYLKKRGEGGGY